MSGGSLDYFYSTLEGHVGDFGDRELDELVKDLANLFYEREWYLSGDTGEGRWTEAREAFKEKWFSKHGRQKRIEKYLDDIKSEVMEMLGTSDKRCKLCKHWTEEKEKDSPYGDCDITRGCLMHRSEHCEKFENRQ